MLSPEILDCYNLVRDHNEGRIKNMLQCKHYIDVINNEVLMLLHLKNDYSDVNNLKAYIETLFFRTSNTTYKRNRTIAKYIEFGFELDGIPDLSDEYDLDRDSRATEILSQLTEEDLSRLNSKDNNYKSLVAKLNPNSTQNKIIATFKKYEGQDKTGIIKYLKDQGIDYYYYLNRVKKLGLKGVPVLGLTMHPCTTSTPGPALRQQGK